MTDTEEPYVEISAEFYAAWDAVHHAASQARNATVAEMRRLADPAVTVVSMHWVDDVDSSRLWLDQLRAADGTVIWQQGVDQETTVTDLLDHLCTYLADDWYEANSNYLNDPLRLDAEGQRAHDHFVIEFAGPLPNHCQDCGAWGTVPVHLPSCPKKETT